MRISNKTWQMTPNGYELIAEDAREYNGPVSLAKGGSPATVNPAQQADAMRLSADLNRTNTSGTYGSSNWTIDPNTGAYTQNVNLDPSQQRQLDTRNQIAEHLIGQAGEDVGKLGGPFNYSDSVSPTARASFDNTISRLQPQFQQQSERQDQDLANSGIPVGSEAYTKEQQKLEQSQNDQIQNAAQTSADLQNNMDVSQRQQQYSDIANLLATRNGQTPTVGTNSAIDTVGTANTLQGGVNSLYNAANAQRQSGMATTAAILAAFL